MAESDAAGPFAHREPPTTRKRLTLAELGRQIEQSLAPARDAMEQAIGNRTRLARAMEAGTELAREAFGDWQESQPQPAANTPEQPFRPPAGQRPRFESSPSKALLAAVRQAFPGFKATDRWWFHLEQELKNAHQRGNPAGHDAFCAAYQNWSAEDLTRHLEAEGRIPPRHKGGRSRKRTVEGMNVGQWVAAMAAADPTFRHLSQREAAKLGPFSARAIGTCRIWIQMKADLEAEALERAEQAKAELEDRQGEDEDANGFRESSTKRGTGIQRVTREDLEHERNVANFLRSKAGQAGKKRPK